MSTASAEANSYDELPYPGQPLAQTDPDRLASLAKLFGVQPQRVDQCRVLELGCATGNNLIPLADRFRESQFVGVDDSQRQIAAGRAAIEHLALKNIKLERVNILDVDERLGQFNYIICHGVFSWVPRNVQKKILEICRSRLTANGLAYVSYNVYPGWHVRDIIREVACGSGSKSLPALERSERAARVIRFLSESLAGDPAPYAKLLKQEIDLLLNLPVTYLFHEYLEDENHPLYFHEFAELIAEHHLQYLGDATPSTMFSNNMGPDIAHNLELISPDLISMEQYMDLVRNRGFRQSVLCQQDIRIERFVAPQQLQGLYLVGKLRPESAQPDILSNAVEKYVVESPSRMTLRHVGVVSSPSPAFKTALLLLGTAWPRGILYEELLDQVAQHIAPAGSTHQPGDEQREGLGQNLVQGVATGILEVFSQPDGFVSTVSERPVASRLARWQATLLSNVTSRRHESVALDSMGQHLLRCLDGEHDRCALLQFLIAAVDRSELSVLVNGIPTSRRDEVEPYLEQSLDEQLANFASNALLVA